MGKTFKQMTSEAMAEVPGISPHEAKQRIQENPHTLFIDVLDLADRIWLGQPIGSVPISAGMLPIRADREVSAYLQDERLADKSRPIITICGNGPLSACSAKTLKDMGFANVSYVAGGTMGWKEAGLPVEQPRDIPSTTQGYWPGKLIKRSRCRIPPETVPSRRTLSCSSSRRNLGSCRCSA